MAAVMSMYPYSYHQSKLRILVANVEVFIPYGDSITFHICLMTFAQVLLMESPHQVYLGDDGAVTLGEEIAFVQVLTEVRVVLQKLSLKVAQQKMLNKIVSGSAEEL